MEVRSRRHNYTNVEVSYSWMNKGGFDWSLVRSFLAALEHGSLLGAARALRTSQPTLGRHIAELERQLGVVLFERTGRGLLPSEDALRLADSARAMEGYAATLWRQARGAHTGAHGTVRLTASQPVACVLLPPLLTRMKEALPDVTVELVSSNAVSNLLRREADIALRMVDPAQASLVTRRIGQINISACAHRDYLRRHGKPQKPEDLQHHLLVGGDQENDVRQHAAALGLAPDTLRFGLRCDDLLAQWAAVRAGLGVGFIAEYVMRTDARVLPLLPALKLPRLPVWLTVHREIRTSARIRAVYDFLAEQVPMALSASAYAPA